MPNKPPHIALVSLIGIIAAISVNITAGYWVARAGLPLYLDTLGTIVLGAACGPVTGAIGGGATLLVWEFITPGTWYWFPVGMALGAVAALCVRMRLFISLPFSILAGFVAALTATLVSVPIRLMMDGASISGESVISSLLMESGRGMLASVLSASFLVEMVDKVTICMAAYFVLKLLTAMGLTRSRQVTAGRPGLLHPPRLTIVGGYLALLILYSSFFVTQFISPEPLRFDTAAHTAFSSIPSPIMQQACIWLAQWGHWAAFGAIALMMIGIARQE